MTTFAPWRLACSLLLVGAGVLAEGCGGAVAPVIGGDGGSSGSSGGGPDGGMPVADTGAPIDSATTTDAPTIGPCEPDGVPCSFASQCCTAVCSAGVCGGAVPTCGMDGSPCQSSNECCSGLCSGDVCGEPTTTCAVSSNANECDVCLAESCCSQLSACESNSTCEESQTCFDACYTGPGSGATCAQKCGMEFPSTQGEALEQCAASGCLTDCE